MIAFFKMAVRNLARHKKRSILTGLMIGVGALMMVLTLAFSQSVGEKMTDSIVRNYTGNLQIHAPVKGDIQVFMDPTDNTPLLKNSGRIRAVIGRDRDVLETTPRLRFQGLLSNGDDSMGIAAMGINPKSERRVTPKIKILRGAYLHSETGLLLGKEVAKYFDAKIGDEFVIVTTTPDGYTNGVSLILQGIVSAEGMEAFFDDNIVYMDIHKVREMLYLNHDEVSETVVALKKGISEDKVRPRLRQAFRQAGLHVRVDNWQDVAGMLSGLMATGVMLPQMSLVILLIVVAIGIINTILMAVLERTKEIGILAAMGTKRREILGLFVAEMTALSVVAAGIGCLLGAGAVYYLSRVGIPAAFQALEFVFGGKRLYFVFSWPGLAISFGGIVLFSALATLFPARLATRQNPVEALRHN